MATFVKDRDGNDVDLDHVVASLIASKGSGDATKALSVIVAENFDLRVKNSKLTDEVKTLKDGLPEGSRVLTKDEAVVYDTYLTYGKPDELKAKIDKGDQAAVKLTELERDTVVRSAADAMGFKHTVLRDLSKAHGLQLEMHEIDSVVDGKTIKVPTPFVMGEQGAKTPLKDVIEARQELKDFLPALTLDSAGKQPNGTPWVSQQGGGAPSPKEKMSAAVLNKYAPANTKKE